VAFLLFRRRQALEEKRHWNLEDTRQMLKPARTDPVGTLFVFLDLLERQPESLRKFSLAHAKHQPPHADTAPHMLVDRIRSLLRHERSPRLPQQQPPPTRRWSRLQAFGPFHHGAGVEIIAPASAQNAPAMTLPSPAADFAPFRSP
jgi:hypothetical protein